MITREELNGVWNDLKGRLQERWGDLTDNELTQAKGNMNQLVGVIEQKTGAGRREIETFIGDVVHSGSSTMNRAAEAVQQYAGQAQERVQEYASAASAAMYDGYENVANRVEEGYEQAATCVRQHPLESMLITFGTGLLAGVMVSLMLRRN